APEPPSPEVIAAERQAAAKEAEKKREQELEESYSEQQERLWTERMGAVGASSDDVVVELVRDWLRNGDFPMLARGFLIFGDRLSSAFTSDGSLALKKLEFADYFRSCDENQLPSRPDFFRRLNQSAMSAHLLSHSDVQLFRSLREEFGSSGVVALMGELPARYAALLFALVPRDTQYDVAKLLPPELRTLVAQQLFASSRMSKSEREYVFSSIHAAMEGNAPPPPPKDLVTDRGPAVDAASALSVLLPTIEAAARSALLAKVLQSGRGAAPRWFEDILFPEMLDRLEAEQRKDLLLDVDIRALAAWLSLQDGDWQRAFMQQLSATMQGALRNNAGFESRVEQVQLAQEAHKQITKALKTQYAKGRAHFVNLAA
ncbi:MAG: hypothetical protein ACO3JL_04600, partial [Myxococcota bacterium]